MASQDRSEERSDEDLTEPGRRWGRGAGSVLPYLAKSLQTRPAGTAEPKEPRPRDGNPVLADWPPRR